jgi:hypothetical protein
MRISQINFDYIEPNQRGDFLAGHVVKFCGGKIKQATEEELILFERRYGEKRPKSKANFYFAKWIERS